MKPIWRAFAFLVALACGISIAARAQTQLSTEDIICRLDPGCARLPSLRPRGVEATGGAEGSGGLSVNLYVNFEYNSDGLKPDGRQILDQLGAALTDDRLKKFSFLIEGHTDGKGSAESNLRLSQRRAYVVREYLVDKFAVENSRLIARGFGKTRLLDPAHPEDAVNRRVQVVNITAATPSKPELDGSRRAQGSARGGEPSPDGADDCAGSGRDDIAACDRLIASGKLTDSQLASAYYNRGLARLDMGEYDRAIADFDQSTGLDPTTAWTFNNRGIAWYAKGNLDRAAADFDQAIRLDPKYALAYNNRGEVLKDRKDFLRAIDDYSAAITLDSGYTAAYVNRGLAYERIGDEPRARDDFNAALSLPGKHADSREALDTARQHLAILASTPPAPAGRRIALVMGNSAYAAAPTLLNVRRDSEVVTGLLRSVGFESVKLATDLTRERFIEALAAFARDAQTADWAVIYFAGHGIEIDGLNYLIPVDAQLENGFAVPFETISLEQALAAVEGAHKLRLVMLDACRDNPFAARMRSLTTRAIGRGLAQTQPAAGTLVVYAAKHGQVALDNDGVSGNSPFVTALAQRLATPGIEINTLFRLLRDDVMAVTNNRQEPYTYGSLSGAEQYYFVSR
jgi:outer membrane protein OmpA-like peptidoglycan-associated protein/tetratricopeptide (TPR) repeat protein